MLPKRKTIRLQNYDYSQSGIYFVTICAHKKSCIFGTISNNAMKYYPLGKIALNEINNISACRTNVSINNKIVMPNHVHILLHIKNNAETINNKSQFGKPIKNSLGTIIGAYKAAVTRMAATSGIKAKTIWQSRYYEHVIRNEDDYVDTWNYIDNNPLKWSQDAYCIKPDLEQ